MSGDKVDFNRPAADGVLRVIETAIEGLDRARRSAAELRIVTGVGTLKRSDTVVRTLRDMAEAFEASLRNAVSVLGEIKDHAAADFDRVEGIDQANADRLKGSATGGTGVGAGGSGSSPSGRTDTDISESPKPEDPNALSYEDIKGGTSSMDKDKVVALGSRWYDFGKRVDEVMHDFRDGVTQPFESGVLSSSGLDAIRDGFKKFSTSMSQFSEQTQSIQKTINHLADGLEATKDAVPGFWTETFMGSMMSIVYSPQEVRDDLTKEAREAIDNVYNPVITAFKRPESAPMPVNPVQRAGGQPGYQTSPGGGGGGGGTGYSPTSGGGGSGTGSSGSGAGSGGSGMDPSQLMQGLGAGGTPAGMDDAFAGGGAMGAMGGLGGLGAGGGSGGGSAAGSAAMRARQAAEAAARLAAQEAAAARGARAGTGMTPGPMMGGKGASASEKGDHKGAAYLRAKHMQEEGLGTPHSYAPEVVDETSVRSFLNLDTGDDGKSTEPPRDKK